MVVIYKAQKQQKQQEQQEQQKSNEISAKTNNKNDMKKAQCLLLLLLIEKAKAKACATHTHRHEYMQSMCVCAERGWRMALKGLCRCAATATSQKLMYDGDLRLKCCSA